MEIKQVKTTRLIPDSVAHLINIRCICRDVFSQHDVFISTNNPVTWLCNNFGKYIHRSMSQLKKGIRSRVQQPPHTCVDAKVKCNTVQCEVQTRRHDESLNIWVFIYAHKRKQRFRSPMSSF